MSISEEDLKTLTKVLSKEVKKALESVISEKEKEEAEKRDFYKDTERLLYSYPLLKLKIAQDEEFLFDPDSIVIPPEKSKDIVKYKSGSGRDLDLTEITNNLKRNMMRTRQEVIRIERALETIQDEKYYEIIPMKYFDGVAVEDIAEKFEVDDRTIRRNKSRLVNKIKVIIFGSDSLN